MWNENEWGGGGGGRLFIKAFGRRKVPISQRVVGINFPIIAKFMPAPISILQKNTKFNLGKLK